MDYPPEGDWIERGENARSATKRGTPLEGTLSATLERAVFTLSHLGDEFKHELERLTGLKSRLEQGRWH